MPDFLQNFTGLAIAGSIIAFYNQIKAGIQKVFSIFIRTDSLHSRNCTELFLQYLLKKSFIIRWGNTDWTNYDNFLVKEKVWAYYLFRKENNLILLYKKYIPIVVSVKEHGINITYLYKTLKVNDILKQVYEEDIGSLKSDVIKTEFSTAFWVDEIEGMEKTIREDGDSQSAKPAYSSEEPKGYSSLFFQPYLIKNYGKYIGIKYDDICPVNENKEEQVGYYWSKEALELRKEVEFFKNNIRWFYERNLSYKYGALLTGTPGTGKSKMVLEIAKHLNIPIRKINISNMSDMEFKRAYHNGGSKFCIILIEDIDRVYHNDINILAKLSLTKDLLSFNTLINTISGVKEQNGIFLIVTCNDKSKLNDALVRPGRLDLKIEVGSIDFDGRMFIAKNILRDFDEIILSTVQKCEGMTVAEFEFYCKNLAIEEFIKRNKK